MLFVNSSVKINRPKSIKIVIGPLGDSGVEALLGLSDDHMVTTNKGPDEDHVRRNVLVVFKKNCHVKQRHFNFILIRRCALECF